jgi:TPR repeat protein
VTSKQLISQFWLHARLLQADKQAKEKPFESVTTAKMHLMALLPAMRKLAKSGSPNAQFYLARAFPIDSETYIHWMYQAAQRGHSDANYQLGISFLDKGQVDKSVRFFKQVLRSSDSYLKDRVKALAADMPRLADKLSQSSLPQHFLVAKTVKTTEVGVSHGRTQLIGVS